MSRILCERTSGTAHRSSAEFAIGWTSNVDRDKAWKLGRVDEIDTLPRVDQKEREENRCEASYGFLEQNRRFATYSYPVTPAA